MHPSNIITGNTKSNVLAKKKRFAHAYVENGMNGRLAAEAVYKPSHRDSAYQQASRMIKDPEVKKELQRIATGEVKLTKDWFEAQMAQRSLDTSRSERSQDTNLKSLGELSGFIGKSGGEVATQTLNVQNVLNIVQNYAYTSPKLAESVEIKERSEDIGVL